MKAWPPPFSPEMVVREASAALSAYRVSRVIGDRYAGEWPKEQFGKQGVLYVESDHPKSDLYLDLIPALTSRHVELPDNPLVLKELRQLERRRGRSGKDTIDHPPGAHDDVANVVAGVVSLLTKEREIPLVAPDLSGLTRESPWRSIGGDDDDYYEGARPYWR